MNTIDTVTEKSAWRPSKPLWHFYCPQCKASRRVRLRPRPETPLRVIQVTLVAAMVTLAAWDWLQWKGMFSFLPVWVLFEGGYRVLARAQLSCPHCGFDPYLYLNDTQRARDEIERFWRAKFDEMGHPYPGDPEPEVDSESAQEEPASHA